MFITTQKLNFIWQELVCKHELSFLFCTSMWYTGISFWNAKLKLILFAFSYFVMISVDGILLSRAVDPSELLMDLGFGGPEKSYISKIPSRFFGESSVSSTYIVTHDWSTAYSSKFTIYIYAWYKIINMYYI